MGIELPAELADVAAQAGVTWPEADEDGMRVAAQAWRDAGTKLTTLALDADTTAQTTLTAVVGDTGDAARRHWSTFVQPDSGHLTAAALGCTGAADRLDHAANQVGAAKVEIVRDLVALAQNSDAANTAAAAGNPMPLAGLDTAVRGTATNVANITTNLVSAVQPATGVDMSGVQNLVNASPGAVTPVVSDPTPVVTDTAQGVGDTAQRGADTVGRITHDGVGVLHPGVAVSHPGVGISHPGVGVSPPGVAVSHPGVGVVPGLPGVEPALPGGPAGTTGPLPIPPVDVGPGGYPSDAPTPPSGLPLGPGQTVQAGLAVGGFDAAAPAAPTQSPGAPAAPAAPIGGQGPGFSGAPGGAPPVGGAPPGGAPVGAGPAPPGGQPAGGQPPGGAAPVAGRPGDRPMLPARPDVAPAAAPAPLGDAPRRAAMAAAVPPGQPAPGEVRKGERDSAEVLFWMHMFPIGHMPVVSDRPARQLAPPPVEVDYAPGLRFEPGDHPRHDLVDAAAGPAPVTRPAEGLAADDPSVAGLADGHDPLGGHHERDWDRRYLVRFGSVTAEGISSAGKEYAWPPAERYPEGGTAPGEAEVLAAGTVIDRFGTPEGRVFSLDATAFARRSLPPAFLESGYRRYRVVREVPVWRTVSAPWFGQPGGGERYRSTLSAVELVALGYLVEITGEDGGGE